jgi:hypothetical protein
VLKLRSSDLACFFAGGDLNAQADEVGLVAPDDAWAE